MSTVEDENEPNLCELSVLSYTILIDTSSNVHSLHNRVMGGQNNNEPMNVSRRTTMTIRGCRLFSAVAVILVTMESSCSVQGFGMIFQEARPAAATTRHHMSSDLMDFAEASTGEAYAEALDWNGNLMVDETDQLLVSLQRRNDTLSLLLSSSSLHVDNSVSPMANFLSFEKFLTMQASALLLQTTQPTT